VARKRCYYCGRVLGRRNYTVDHKKPKCKGGTNRESNLVDCCKNCNQDKNGLLLDEYRAVVAFRKGLLGEIKMKFYGETKV